MSIDIGFLLPRPSRVYAVPDLVRLRRSRESTGEDRHDGVVGEGRIARVARLDEVPEIAIFAQVSEPSGRVLVEEVRELVQEQKRALTLSNDPRAHNSFRADLRPRSPYRQGQPNLQCPKIGSFPDKAIVNVGKNAPRINSDGIRFKPEIQFIACVYP